MTDFDSGGMTQWRFDTGGHETANSLVVMLRTDSTRCRATRCETAPTRCEPTLTALTVGSATRSRRSRGHV